jgi:ATP synthase F1 delta subunit
MEEIAQVYARSLFEAAKDQDKLDEIREQLGMFADAVAESHDLQVFFFSPYLSTQEKTDGLRHAIEGADEAFLNFLDLLVENHRMPVIFRIRREFDELWEDENQLLPVQVTSAVPLDDAIVQEIGSTIGEQTGKQVQLSSRVDPDILGGIVVRAGNAILDASIRNRLEQLRKQVAKAA